MLAYFCINLLKYELTPTLYIRHSQSNYIKIMSRRQHYQRETQAKMPAPKVYCSKGWHCSNLLKNRCEYTHDRDDRKTAEKLNKIFTYKDTIVVLDTYDPKSSPMCLIDPTLPIHIINQAEIKMDVQTYFVAVLINDQKPNQITLKLQKTLGYFGDWETEHKILTNYFPKEYELQKNQNDKKSGEIKINGQLKKVITGHQGKKYYFEKVNKPCNYPLLNGCKVSYVINGNNIKLTKIDYPRQIRLSGIVQIDSNSQFYFISRNQEYDDMNPYTIPNELAQKLNQFKGLFPYSFLKIEPLSEQKQTKINNILKEYLVKGRFKGWPLHCKYPIIELLDQVNIKNFKYLKDGIIYEAGISMTPFDKKQKEDSQKLAKKFKIEDYESGRQIFEKQVFTVDSKTTRCHDDAFQIQPLKNGGFLVQIHIADVAALIQQGENLDKKIKKRDETIYIKNYYQPMLYDSLKNLLSLKEKQEKLVFTLRFKVNNQGFIDYKTVSFHKNIVVVQKNLSHERLDSGSETYPELLALNRLFDRSKLVDNNYILQSQTKSQVAVSRLIFISSIIPTYLLQINIQVAKQFKESFEQYLKRMIEGRKKDMEKWQSILDNIDKWRNEQSKKNKQLKSIQKKIDNELNKQRQTIIKRLKDQQKDIKKKKQVKEKKLKKTDVNGVAKSEIGSQTFSLDQQEQVQLNYLAIQLNEDVKKRQQIEIQQQKEDEIRQQKKLKLKQKRAKALKEVNLSDLESQSSESQQKQQTQSEDQHEDEQFRYNAAVNGQKFLQKIFRHSFFNIDIKWESLDEINKAFKTILSKDKGKLYQEYFKRLQIMNRQHFKYIVRMQREKIKQKNMNSRQQVGQRQSQRGYRRERNNRMINGNKNSQKLPQEKLENSIKNNKQQLSNKIQKRQREVINKFKDAKILQQCDTEQLVSYQISQIQYVEKRTQNKDMKKISQKKQKTKIKIESKQFQYGSSDKKIETLIQITEQVKPLDILQNKKFEEQDPQQLQNDQKIGKQPKKKFVLDKTKVKLVMQLKGYMQAQSEKYSEKYGQQYAKDPKLTNLDISFNEIDNKIAKKYDQATIKEQKIKRLKCILRRSAKTKQRTTRVQQKKVLKTKRTQKNTLIEQQIDQGIDLKINQKLALKIKQKQDFYINKYRQSFISGQKLQFSSDQQCFEKPLQLKSAYKTIKAKKIIFLLSKNQKEEKKKKSKTNKIKIQQQQIQQLSLIDRKDEIDQIKIQKKDISMHVAIKQQIKDQRGRLVHDIKKYMNMERDRYVQKYQQQYRKDKKLNKLDISFNEEDKKIIGSFPVNILKKQKKDRLLLILQKLLKDKPRQNPNSQKKKNQQKEKKKQEQKIQPQLFKKFKASLEQKNYYFLQKYKQAYCQDQKIQLSSDQELPVNVQSKDVYKSAKSIYVFGLLRKVYKSQRVKKSQKNIMEQKVQQKKETKVKEIVKNFKPQQIKVQLAIPQRNLEKEVNNVQKLSKKQLKKKIEQLLQPIIEVLNKKYDQQKISLKQKIEQIKENLKEQRQVLHKQLQNATEQFNLLQLLTEQEQNKKQSKKNRKQKKSKKTNKDQKDQKSSILLQFIENFKEYADSANFKFKQMTIKEIDAYLQNIVKLKNIYEQGEEKIQVVNRQASKKGQKQQKLLKWNNPIRSYESLTVMRLIKSYKWLFEGAIYPSDIIRYHGDIKQVERSLSDLQDYRRQKMERGELNKKVKEANRQISKLQFYNILKRDQNAVFTFLNIGSPCPERVKFVFHPILQEIEVDNLQFKQDIYKEVKGKVKIIRDFPLKLRVKLEK